MSYRFNGDASDYAEWAKSVAVELASLGHTWDAAETGDVYSYYVAGWEPYEVADVLPRN